MWNNPDYLAIKQRNEKSDSYNIQKGVYLNDPINDKNVVNQTLIQENFYSNFNLSTGRKRIVENPYGKKPDDVIEKEETEKILRLRTLKGNYTERTLKSSIVFGEQPVEPPKAKKESIKCFGNYKTDIFNREEFTPVIKNSKVFKQREVTNPLRHISREEFQTELDSKKNANKTNRVNTVYDSTGVNKSIGNKILHRVNSKEKIDKITNVPEKFLISSIDFSDKAYKKGFKRGYDTNNQGSYCQIMNLVE